MTIAAIIFDCFGVLYPDTYWTMADNFLGDKLESHRNELHDLVRQVDLGHITREQLWEQFAEIVGVSSEVVYSRLKEFGGLDKRLLTFIDIHRSTFKIGMISNVGSGFLERMFVERPASDHFDVIILSSEVGLVKPDKRIYELAAEKLDVRLEECVFIDDLETNVLGAKSAGMQALQYKNYAQFIKEVEQLLN